MVPSFSQRSGGQGRSGSDYALNAVSDNFEYKPVKCKIAQNQGNTGRINQSPETGHLQDLWQRVAKKAEWELESMDKAPTRLRADLSVPDS